MLYDDYRPLVWAQFVGNGKTVAALRAATARAKAGNKCLAAIIQGASGTGKTTLARIAASDLTIAPEWDVVELDGDKCSVDAIRALEQTGVLSTRGVGGYRVVIVNECHAMSRQAVNAWLTLLERLPARSAVIFTTTEGRGESDLFGNFTSPFLSRCLPFSLTNQGLAQAFVDTNTDAGGGWSHAESEEDAAIEAIGHDLHSLRTFDSADDVREFLAANEKVTGQQKFHQDINVCIEMRKQAEALGWLATVGN